MEGSRTRSWRRFASADEEFEFDLDVQDALQLSAEDAERLTGDVNEALTLEG